MQYVFGPVPSRRLGQSLGVDPIPSKTCNWNCAYCQLGRTSPMTNQRRDYYPPAAIVDNVLAALGTHEPGEIDWVTFVGSGEPTLHASLGYMIREIKAATKTPVAVLTNGSLLYRPEVREELMAADAVLPSLDAGSAALYRRINRPRAELTFKRLVDGLATFRRQYRGRFWVEVMMLRGINDTQSALRDLASILSRIGPDAVHVNRPVRPPAEAWVRSPTGGALSRAATLLGQTTQVVWDTSDGIFDLSGDGDPVKAVLDVIGRHPMTEKELVRALNRQWPGRSAKLLDRLAASGQALLVTRGGQRFWSASEGRYPDLLPAGSNPRTPTG